MYIFAVLLCCSVMAFFALLPLRAQRRATGSSGTEEWDDGVVLNKDFLDLILKKQPSSGRRPRRPTLADTTDSGTTIFRAPSARDLPKPANPVETIDDFDATEDRIEILYDDAVAGPPPSLQIVDGEEGVELRVDGFTVARLAEGTQISRDDVRLIKTD